MYNDDSTTGEIQWDAAPRLSHVDAIRRLLVCFHAADSKRHKKMGIQSLMCWIIISFPQLKSEQYHDNFM